MMRKQLLESGAVGLVDGVVLMGEGAVDAVCLLRHDVDPAALVAAREAGVGAPARHVVEHGDVLGDADRVLGGEHDAELADADALRLHPDEEVEQHGIGRQLEALDVEVVLGEAHRIVAEGVGEARLLAELRQHALVEVATKPRHSLLDLRAGADGGQVEEGDLHAPPLIAAGRVDRQRSPGAPSLQPQRPRADDDCLAHEVDALAPHAHQHLAATR